MPYAQMGFLAVCLALGSLGQAAQNEKTELEGRWTQVAVNVNGAAKKPAANAVLIVTGTKFVIQAGDKIITQAIFTTDPTKKPKMIDVDYVTGESEGMIKGIYELKGHELRFRSAASPADPRPTDFTAAPGTKGIFMLFRRAKK